MNHLIERAIHEARQRAGHSSVWPHSTQRSYLIFCVGQPEERISQFLQWAFQHQVGVKPLVGQYLGQPERSFIANMKDYEEIEPWLLKEESILVLDDYDARDRPRARLRYQDGREVHLGRLRSVTREHAMQQLSWTFDPVTNAYFVAEPV